MRKDDINALNKCIAHNIHLYRIKRDLSMRDLAKQIGVSYQQVSKYESGDDTVSAARLYLIAKALKVTISKLIENDTID